MTLEEKIGQLLISRPRARNIEKSIKNGTVGGLYVPPEMDPARLRELKGYAKIPLLVAADLECGTFSGCGKWPCALAAAKSGCDGVYRWARIQAEQARAAGVNAVFGPVFDIAMNRRGIAAGVRTLGETAQEVAKLATYAVKGYHDGGLLTFSKHYPGFGRATDDAHISLSHIDCGEAEFYENDILPYLTALDKSGLSGVMTGHIGVPAIDNAPTPMSKKLVDILRERGADGLFITDSLAMKSIQFFYSEEELYVGALRAGHDLILVDYNTDDAQGAAWILKAVRDGRLSEDEIDRKLKRVLRVKERLSQMPTPEPDIAAQQAAFLEMSRNSIDSGKPVDPAKSTLFVISDPDTRSIDGEVSCAGDGAAALTDEIRTRFKNSKIMYIDAFPRADDIADVLYWCLKYEQTVYIAHVPMKAYYGTARFSDPLRELVHGTARKNAAFVVWGNPFAGDDLAPDTNIFRCYDSGDFAKALFEKLTAR